MKKMNPVTHSFSLIQPPLNKVSVSEQLSFALKGFGVSDP